MEMDPIDSGALNGSFPSDTSNQLLDEQAA